MRTVFDFSPLYRSSVGFDRVFDLLENAARVETIDNWPPYDIERTGEDRYKVTMAVAGFSAEEIEITKHPNLLIVSGNKPEKDDEERQVLHRGIATRSFQRRFQLADHVEVAGADLADGLLTIELVREVPEAMRPKQISVNTGAAEPARLEEKQAA